MVNLSRIRSSKRDAGALADEHVETRPVASGPSMVALGVWVTITVTLTVTLGVSIYAVMRARGADLVTSVTTAVIIATIGTIAMWPIAPR